MLWKCAKISAVVLIGSAVVGGLVFGSDLVSYVGSSAASVRSAVKESVPIEFELRRARHTLEEIIPEMHANIRLIAAEEVEVASLRDDIGHSETTLVEEKVRIDKLCGLVTVRRTSYTIGGRKHTHQAVKADLARRFDRYKELELMLASKQRLLGAREKSLQTAIAMVDKARQKKALLQDKIEMLASQHRMVQAASVGSKIQMDQSKLAQTDRMIRQIKKRLDVAERVLAHEGRFIDPIHVDVIDEQDLLGQIRDHFGTKTEAASADEKTDDASARAEADAEADSFAGERAGSRSG